MKKLDILHNKFNKLYVISVDRSKCKKPYALVQCDCGHQFTVLAYSVTSGNTKSCGSCFVRELVGKKNGRLTVVSVHKPVKGYSCVRCICDCGNEVSVGTKKFPYKKSCGCLQKEHQATFLGNLHRGKQPAHTLPKGHAAARYVYKNYQRNAKQQGVAFELTKEKFIEITQRNCYYCDIKPLQVFHLKMKLNGLYTYNGIDKVIPSLGYVESNVVACCWTCNRFKSDLLSRNEMSEVIKLLKSLRGNDVWGKDSPTSTSNVEV